MNLLSVTKVLSPFADFSMVPPQRLAMAAERGTQVHAACAAYAKGFPVITFDDAALYFESFRNWFDCYVKRALYVEAEFSDPCTYRIAGHPELICEMIDGRIVVVDYKTPAAESKLWRAQIAAYCYLAEPVIGGRPEGLALMLSADGRPPRARHYNYQAEDFAAFVAALTAYRHFKGE